MQHDAPPGSKRVFITATQQTGAFGGLAGGDALCTTAAATLGGGTWKAWLSTHPVHAIERITGSGPWFDTLGYVVFANREQLMTKPARPIFYDEAGGFLQFGLIWTGTAPGGTYVATPSGPPCAEWTSAERSAQAKIGLVGARDLTWTAQTNMTCDQQAHLLCFEQ
ncbi:MAG: hypothetical protein H0T42_16440 [Deltaproteobacteria bacterium]|nr:hypothetical protein [Deltaproteobacteria bacterium]